MLVGVRSCGQDVMPSNISGGCCWSRCDSEDRISRTCRKSGGSVTCSRRRRRHLAEKSSKIRHCRLYYDTSTNRTVHLCPNDIDSDDNEICSKLDSKRPVDGSIRHSGRRRVHMIGCANQTSSLKQPISAVITTFVIAALSSACYATSSHNNGNRCLLPSCVGRLSEYERQIAGGQLTFDLDAGCRLFDDMQVCVRRAMLSCPTDSPIDDVRDRWIGINASLTYICKTVRQEFSEHSKCYAAVTSPIKKCNKTYHMKMETLAITTDDVCRLTKTLIQCVNDETKTHCQNDEAASYLSTAVRFLRQPRLEYHSCSLDCSIVRSSLLLISTAALISTYLSTRGRFVAYRPATAFVTVGSFD